MRDTHCGHCCRPAHTPWVAAMEAASSSAPGHVLGLGLALGLGLGLAVRMTSLIMLALTLNLNLIRTLNLTYI